MPRHDPDTIPADLAANLKGMGLSWAAIGRMIARQRGRSVPYQARAVANAVRRERISQDTAQK